MKHYLYCDGASRGNPGPASFGFVLTDGEGDVVIEGGDVIGVDTNNVAEYSGLIAGLEVAVAEGVEELEIRLDSLLLVKQLEGEYRVRAAGLKPLHRRAAALISQIPRVAIKHIPREANTHADALANQALDGDL